MYYWSCDIIFLFTFNLNNVLKNSVTLMLESHTFHFRNIWPTSRRVHELRWPSSPSLAVKFEHYSTPKSFYPPAMAWTQHSPVHNCIFLNTATTHFSWHYGVRKMSSWSSERFLDLLKNAFVTKGVCVHTYIYTWFSIHRAKQIIVSALCCAFLLHLS